MHKKLGAHEVDFSTEESIEHWTYTGKLKLM